MKKQTVKVKSVEHNTHDVLHIVTEKPEGIHFTPGQATEIFIDEIGWRNEGRPFTFVSLPDSESLEFMIKTYPSHKGVTEKLLELKADDSLLINDVFGAITYKGEGTFIAGGAGITPFISILRDLKAKNELGNNTLIFANKAKKDIILEKELHEMMGNKFINILSEEEVEGYANGRISEDFMKQHANSLNAKFYVCGPPPMMQAIKKQLVNLKVDKNNIIEEEF